MLEVAVATVDSRDPAAMLMLSRTMLPWSLVPISTPFSGAWVQAALSKVL